MGALRDARALGPVLVAAVGPATADALRQGRRGARPGAGRAQRGVACSRRSPTRRPTGAARCCSRRRPGAPATIPDGLPEGVGGGRVEAYRTVARAGHRAGAAGRVAEADALTFTATSTVQAFLAPAHAPTVGPCRAAPRGLHRSDDRPTAAREAGLADVHEAWGASAQGIVDELIGDLGPRAAERPVGWCRWSRPRSAPASGGFPERRLRRLRRTPALRRLVAETRLASTTWSPRCSCARASTSRCPSPRCPARSSTRVDSLVHEAKRLASLGRARARPVRRARRTRTPSGSRAPGTPTASSSWRSRDLRDEVGDELVLIADLCLDEYTDHGHCGVLGRRRRGRQRRHPRAATPRWPWPRPRPGPTWWPPAG